MTYNLHPMLVHFPIAFFVAYSALRIVPLERWIPSVTWKHIRLVVLVIGIAGAFLALSSGEVAEDLVHVEPTLLETHAFFATLSTWLYGVLFAGEFLTVVNPLLSSQPALQPVVRLLTFLEKILAHRILLGVLAVLGLVAISVTGLLGGVMVYGVTADPLARIVCQMLGIPL